MATRKGKRTMKTVQKKMNEVIGGITGKKVQEEKNPEEQAAEQIARANDMVSVLKTINFSTSPLPAEMLQKKHSPDQRKTDMEMYRDAGVSILQRGTVTEYDTKKIDETLHYAVHAFEEGVRNGQPEKAQKGGFTVLLIANTLRKDIEETDHELSDAIVAQREEMCSYLKTMLKLCKKVDALESIRAKKLTSFDKIMQEMQTTQDELQEYLNTEEGGAVMDELQEYAIHPEKRSQKAQKLDNTFTILSRKEAHLFQLSGELRQLEIGVTEQRAQLDNVLETINGKGYAEDSELQGRVEEILKQRQDDLIKIKEDNRRATEALDRHNAAMQAIISDPTNAERTANNLEFWADKQRRMEKERERQIQRKKKHIEEMREQRERQRREQELDETISQLQNELDEAELQEELAIYQDEDTEQELLYND